MSDIFSQTKRSDIMSKISSKDTKPEILVRKFLFSKGFRYRINVKNIKQQIARCQKFRFTCKTRLESYNYMAM